MQTTWQVTEYEHGLPILKALALRIPTAPTGFLRKSCSKERLRRETIILSATTTVNAGDELALSVSRRMEEILAQCPLLPGQILHEDRYALVLDKPAGLATHATGSREDNLQERLQDYLKARGETYRVSPIHRLDRGTSGPLLFGKGKRATGNLGKLFMRGAIDKEYLALVTGKPPLVGTLLSPVPSHGKFKPAEAHFRRLAQCGEFSLLQLQLLTGRSHQLRRQLAAVGCSILGDSRYGGKPWPGLANPCLHCSSLTFTSLEDDAPRTVRSAIPAPLQAILTETGLAIAAAECGQR